MKTLNLAATAVCACLLHGTMSDVAHAVPVQFAGTGNYYDFIEFMNPSDVNNNTWDDAKTAAAALSHLGASGHLVTLTSQAENDFVFGIAPNAQATNFIGAWIGGIGRDLPVGTGAPDRWLVGPEATIGGGAMTYTNWNGIEPNNEGYAYMNIANGATAGRWFDDSLAGSPQGTPSFPQDPVIGFFVEFESDDISAVPLPAALPLLAGGLGLMGLVGWRRRRKTMASAG